MHPRNELWNFDALLACISLAVLLGTILLQVVLRFVFRTPLIGAEEFTRYMVVCVVMTPLAFTERTKSHVVMEELQAVLPAPIRRFVAILSGMAATVVYALVTLSAFSVLLNNSSNVTATLKMPFWLFFLPSVLGLSFITVVRLVTHLCDLLHKELPWESR